MTYTLIQLPSGENEVGQIEIIDDTKKDGLNTVRYLLSKGCTTCGSISSSFSADRLKLGFRATADRKIKYLESEMKKLQERIKTYEPTN